MEIQEIFGFIGQKAVGTRAECVPASLKHTGYPRGSHVQIPKIFEKFQSDGYDSVVIFFNWQWKLVLCRRCRWTSLWWGVGMDRLVVFGRDRRDLSPTALSGLLLLKVSFRINNYNLLTKLNLKNRFRFISELQKVCLFVIVVFFLIPT